MLPVIDDVDCDETTVDPPAPLLPLLSLPEAQALLPLLAAVRDGGVPDREAAGWLLGNLAARVPSTDPDLPTVEEPELAPSKAFERILRPRERPAGQSARRRLIAEVCGDPLPEAPAPGKSGE